MAVMAKAKTKKRTAKQAKAERNAGDAKELTDEDLEQVAGGGKQIANVKYEDITINCGTGMSKN